jgi:hypothetical protein
MWRIFTGCVRLKEIRWLIGLPATTIKQQATETKGEPKFILPISAE